MGIKLQTKRALISLFIREFKSLLEIPKNMIDSITVKYENPDRLYNSFSQGYIAAWKATDRNGFDVRLYKEYEI